MKPQTAIQKGKQLENYISELISEYKLGKARRSHGSGSGNKEKADIDTDMMINGENIGIECKNYSNAHVQDWWKQAEKLRPLSRVPVVAYKLKGESLLDTKIIINVHDFMTLCKKAQEPKTKLYTNNRELQYKLSRLKQTAHDVLKEIK